MSLEFAWRATLVLHTASFELTWALYSLAVLHLNFSLLFRASSERAWALHGTVILYVLYSKLLTSASSYEPLWRVCWLLVFMWHVCWLSHLAHVRSCELKGSSQTSSRRNSTLISILKMILFVRRPIWFLQITTKISLNVFLNSGKIASYVDK